MAGEDNLTAILYKTDDIRLEQQPVPEPGADQVRKLWALQNLRKLMWGMKRHNLWLNYGEILEEEPVIKCNV